MKLNTKRELKMTPTSKESTWVIAIPADFENDSLNTKKLSTGALRNMGSVQIGIGVVLWLLSIIGIIFDSIAIDKVCENSNEISGDFHHPFWVCWNLDAFNQMLLCFDLICLILSGWYVLTGFVPLCMARKEKPGCNRLKTWFTACSIIGASVVGPTMFSLGVVGTIQRLDNFFTIVVSSFTALLSFAEVLLSIMAALYCRGCLTRTANQSNNAIVRETRVKLCPAKVHYFTTHTGKPEDAVRRLKVLGLVQIGNGVVLVIICLICIILDDIAKNKTCLRLYEFDGVRYAPDWFCTRLNDHNQMMFVFDIVCFALSGWYVVIGVFPLCISKKKEMSWRGLRIVFMACSIIGASICVPIMVGLSIYGAIQRQVYDLKLVVFSAMITLVSLAELVSLILSAAYCCFFCLPWKTNDRMLPALPVSTVTIPQTQTVTMTLGRHNVFYAGQHWDDTMIQHPWKQL